jgi:ParB/RepB/Spo0J family partition protein
MSEISKVKVSSIDPNPMRQLAEYPFNEAKIEALRRSIQDVGLWEGIIGRKKGPRIQIAFGHHRWEAARQELGEDGRIPIIIRDLTDEQMLQFMGRENLEDYNANFLVMLETWEAAASFYERDLAQKPQDIEVARLLGWVRSQPGDRKGETRIDNTATACSKAHALVQGGYIKRKDLDGLSVFSVREIVERVASQHEQLERMAKTTGRPSSETESAKRHSGKAGGRVARDVRAGKVATKDIRGQVDVEAYRHAKEAKKQSPLFSMFGKSLADSIAKIAKSDGLAEKFNDIKKALGVLTFDEDVEVVKRIAFECEGASKRFTKWHVTFSDPRTKVVKLKEIG